MNKARDVKQSAFKGILNFMRRSKINHFLVGYSAFFGLAMLVYLTIIGLIIPTYYAVAPARSFVDYYYARVADTPVGTEPQLTLCRRINYDDVKIEAVRTFIYHTENGSEIVGEYEFDANVSQGESDNNCINVRLKGQPMVAGNYSTSTSIEFYVGGFRKTYSYNSNEYKMTPIAQSSEERIKDLQRQIDDINRTSDADNAQSYSETPSSQPQQPQNSTKAQVKPLPATEAPPKKDQPTILGGINQILRGLGL